MKRKGNPVGCTGKSKRLRGNIREGSREDKTGTVSELSLKVRLALTLEQFLC